MKKFYNYRPLVSMALFLIAGIVFACGILSGDIFQYVLAGLMLVALIVTVVIKSIKKVDKLIFKIVSIIVCFIISSTTCFGILFSYDKRAEIKGTYVIEGMICADFLISEDSKYVLLVDDANAINEKTGEKIDFKRKVRVYLESGDGRVETLKLGDRISIKLSLRSVSLKYNGSRNYYLYNKGISALGFGSEDDIKFVSHDPSVFDRFKLKIRTTLDKFISDEYSSLAYTMLFGDKANLSETIADNYSASGIGHILAVSGLHVGFIVTVLSLILSLFRAGNKFKFYFITIVLFLYTMMCGFTVSVTRAFIMTAVMLFCKMKYKEYDSLNALACAAIIILLINPLQLYDVGFRLSFCAVLGILLISPVLKRSFSTFLYNKLASSLAISIGAAVGTMPIMCMYFESISLLSVVANMILIPIVSIAFMFMLVFVLLAMMLEGFGVFLYVFEFLMKFVTKTSSFLGAWTLSGANETLIMLFSALVLALCLVFSDYIFIEKKKKVICSSVLGPLTLICLVLSFIC